MSTYVCDSCGNECDELVEGYCADCHQERQRVLDEHNAQRERWRRMTPAQREAAILWAMSNPM